MEELENGKKQIGFFFRTFFTLERSKSNVTIYGTSILSASYTDLQNAVKVLENLHESITNVLHYTTSNGNIILGTDKDETDASGLQSLTGTTLNDTIYGNDGDDVILIRA